MTSRLKNLIRENPVHERRIEVRTYPLGDDQLIVEGRLRDERLVKGYEWNEQPCSPGVIHLICVRLLVGNWPVTILDAEAEMEEIPHRLCPTILDGVKKIVGLPIIAGYSEKITGLLGGVRGCNHLTHLIVDMGTAALHGYWTNYVPHPSPDATFSGRIYGPVKSD
ncbi:MAG: DUF2889 domain-containing protein [Deltaproteobacteria bacterium]|nr:DUF2889 domain-containing protein [Deltaproteobacteria bacterium]